MLAVFGNESAAKNKREDLITIPTRTADGIILFISLRIDEFVIRNVLYDWKCNCMLLSLSENRNIYLGCIFEELEQVKISSYIF